MKIILNSKIKFKRALKIKINKEDIDNDLIEEFKKILLKKNISSNSKQEQIDLNG